MKKEYNIAVIGLGYVGLPLAVEFSKQYNTYGFDIDANRIAELNSGFDKTLEISDDKLKIALEKDKLHLVSQASEISSCNVYIITVPTPTDNNNKPVFTPLISASKTVASVLKKGDIVVYESTVYPGATEEVCVPVLEEAGLKFNTDFFVGYSPERINPGDKTKTVAQIVKVTSGSTPEIGKEVDDLYAAVITAGTHLAPTIKVAEAAKVIENSQRDINIAFVNELSKIFRLLDIDTKAVLQAAGTKWNFLNFSPGLVGGHCIGVDPYYLADKAQSVGYNPEIILAGRRMNDSMGSYIAQETVKMMITQDIPVKAAKVLILGMTFKENCPDIRNSRVIDIYEELKTFNTNIDVYDPWAKKDEVAHEYQIDLLNSLEDKKYEAIIIAVSHKEFLSLNLEGLKENNAVVFDVKSMFPEDKIDARL